MKWIIDLCRLAFTDFANVPMSKTMVFNQVRYIPND